MYFSLEESMTKKNLTLYIDDDVQTRFKQVMLSRKRSVSGEIEDHMKARINEHEGRADVNLEASATDYEALKRQHIKLVAEADKLSKYLERTGKFDDLADFAKNLGLDFEAFNNLAELAPQMLEKWHVKGEAKENMHLFITFLETLKEKATVEARLEETRKKATETKKNNEH